MFRWPHVLSWVVMGWSTAFSLGSQLDSVSPEKEKTVTAIRIQQAIVVDGVLDEPQWELAEPVSDFTQQEPRMGDPASEVTEARLL